MGWNVLAVIAESPTFEVGGAVVAPEENGTEVGPQRVTGYSDVGAVVADSDVVVDFSSPEGFSRALSAAVDNQRPFVSGTTGLGREHVDALDDAARLIPVLHAANFSLGVNLLAHLVEIAAAALPDYDIEILEAHHRRKVDAPSGTALMLGRAAASGRDVDLEERANWGRKGHAGPRPDGEIGFQVVRGGTIAGEHTVFYCGEDERIELTHRAQDRRIWAVGALRAGEWLRGREPGRWTIKQMILGE